MGTINCRGKNPLMILESALRAGVTMFQLREKGEGALKGKAYVDFSQACQQLCKQYNVPFIVNDDVHLALELDADGIHVGQADLQLGHFRKQCPNKIVGVSVHTLAQFKQALQDGADYVGIGAVFETKSKADAVQSSFAFLKEARLAYPDFPIVAIGGITSKNSYLVRQMGVNGVAVISEIVESDNIKQTVSNL